MEEPRYVVGVIEEEETALAIPQPTAPAGNPFATMWAGAYAGAEGQLHRAWEKLREQWLRSKFRMSESDETRRSYETAINLWLDFLTTIRHPDGRPVQPWEVTSYHVEAWQSKLEIEGLAPTTIKMIGPLISRPAPTAIQKPATVIRAGFCFSIIAATMWTSAHCAPAIVASSIASVLAIVDSPTSAGALASKSAAKKPVCAPYRRAPIQ